MAGNNTGFGSLLAGGLISGVLGLGKAVVGGIQLAKGNRQMNNLLANRPKYNIPDAYQKALGIYQGLAAGEMPGMNRYEQQIGQATARALTGAERGAISSNAYQGAVSNAQDKELQALQDLALRGVEYKTNAMQNLASAQQQYGQLQDQAFNYNVAQPYDIKLNMANERRQAGAANLWGGLGEMGSSAINFLGTRYYADMLKGLQTPQGGGVSQPIGNVSAPLINANLANTASNIAPKATFPTQYDWMWSNLKKQGYNNG